MIYCTKGVGIIDLKVSNLIFPWLQSQHSKPFYFAKYNT